MHWSWLGIYRERRRVWALLHALDVRYRTIQSPHASFMVESVHHARTNQQLSPHPCARCTSLRQTDQRSVVGSLFDSASDFLASLDYGSINNGGRVSIYLHPCVMHVLAQQYDRQHGEEHAHLNRPVDRHPNSCVRGSCSRTLTSARPQTSANPTHLQTPHICKPCITSNWPFRFASYWHRTSLA